MTSGMLSARSINWTNADLLSVGHSKTTFREILIEIQTISFKNTNLKMSSVIVAFL